jgi:hypothetical protein
LHSHGRWFSPGSPASSISKTGRHEIAEILLKVVLNIKNQIKIKSYNKEVYMIINKKKNYQFLILQIAEL